MKLGLRIILLLSLGLATSSCNLSSESMFAPRPFRMGDPPDGNPEFKLGWKHGCNTGMSTMATSYYKSFYRFNQDPEMITNQDYYKAWKDGYTYCRQYMFKWTNWAWDS